MCNKIVNVSNDEKFSAAMIYLLPILGWAIWKLKKEESDFIDFHGKNALNFQITFFLVVLLIITIAMLYQAFYLIARFSFLFSDKAKHLFFNSSTRHLIFNDNSSNVVLGSSFFIWLIAIGGFIIIFKGAYNAYMGRRDVIKYSYEFIK